MSRSSSPEPYRLKDILDSLGHRMGLGKAAQTATVWSRWVEIVGPANADHAEPTSLRQGVLRVRASSPAWATELGYLATVIRDRANELAGPGVVTEVRIWTGPGPLRRQERPPPATSTDALPQPKRKDRDPDPAAALERARRAWAKRRR